MCPSPAARLTMTVPVYWGRPAGAIHYNDLVFDHPTPLDGADTLGRLLDSIATLDDHDFQLVIIVAPVAPELEDAALARTRQIVAACNPGVPVRLLAPAGLETAAGHLADDAVRHDDLLSLEGYPHVRNACLLAAIATGADHAVLIDDDEVFHDSGFIGRVREGINHIAAPTPAILAGYYISGAGEYLLNRPTPTWGARWPKYQVMDEAFRRIIGAPPRFKRTPFAFGGNFCIPAAVFRSLPFDTTVTRGEDLDYLMMAALHGFDTILDNELSITHLAPPKSHPDWQQFRQDALRFARQRAKLDHVKGSGLSASLSAADLDPYPGYFLRADLEERVVATADALAAECRARGDHQGAAEGARTLELFMRTMDAAAKSIADFIDQRDRWRRILEVLRGEALEGILIEA